MGTTIQLDEQLVTSAARALVGNPELLAEFQKQRGLDLLTISHFQLGYHAHIPLLWNVGSGEGWTIPVRDGAGKLVGMRCRSRTGTGTNRYRPWAAGEKPALFEALRERDAADPAAVVVCFGEYDAAMLWQQGFNAVGVPGISVMKEAWLGQLSQRFERIYVLPDNQWSEMVAAARLVQQGNRLWNAIGDDEGNLRRPGDGFNRWRLVCWPHEVVEGDDADDLNTIYRTVRAGELGPQVWRWRSLMAEKADASEWFIYQHSAAEFAALLGEADGEDYAARVLYLQGMKEEAESPPREAGVVQKRPSYLQPVGRWIYPVSELAQRPALQWLVQDEIMEGTLICLVGSPGVGKSFLALDYALQVAQQGPVVYLAAERAGSFPARIEAWLTHHGGSEANLLLCPRPLNLLNPGEVAEFAAEFKTYGPRLLVVDTLARCMVGADENSAQAMGMAIHNLRQLQEETRAAVMIVHHLNKSGRAERGSGALRGAADTIILVRKNEYDDLTISCDKQADAAEFATRYASRVAIGDSCVIVGKGESSEPKAPLVVDAPAREMRREDMRHQLLKALADEEVRATGLNLKHLTEFTNVPRTSVFRLLNQMYDADLVMKQAGGIYTITMKGLLELDSPS